MTEFKDINPELKEIITKISQEDPYGLNPETLYSNIYNSTGSVVTLSQIFEIPTFIIAAIKEQ